MRPELLKAFPRFTRLNAQNKIEFAWRMEESMRNRIEKGLQNLPQCHGDPVKDFGKLAGQKNILSEKGTLELYQVNGSLKHLALLNEVPAGEASQGFLDGLFPVDNLIDYATAPQTIINIIADRVKESVQFERFDLVRVNRSLRRFNYEYSIGVDIEGRVQTAYKEISNSGLAWVLYHEKPYLVENFLPETHHFSEDPWLYQTGFRSILRVPIIFNRGVIGAILLASVEPERFQVEDALLLEKLAQGVAPAFFHAGVQEEQEYHTLAAATLLQTIAGMGKLGRTTEFFDAYCQVLRQLAKTDRVGLFLIDEEADKYCCLAEAGKKLAVSGEWLPIRKLPFREMLQSKSIVAFNLADQRHMSVGELLGRGFTAVLYAPITDAKGKIRACLGTATSDESATSKEMAGLFKVACEQLAFIMAQSILNLGNDSKMTRDVAVKPPGFEEVIGSSQTIQETIQKAAAVSQYEFPILLLGETGTGKELFAKAIHRSSPRAKGPFIVVNSAAIPDNLLESELFGYKEGAFTGGLKGGKKGKILLAHGGTLFLDEIGELSLELQAKLLRVIQEKEVEPLGAEKPVSIEVRVISATHRNLKEMVKRQEFREDLYYRLNSIEIKIPPLRERGEDIIELAESMLEELARRNSKRMKKLSHEAVQALLEYDFPGNIRQLQNVMNWAFVFADDDLIKMEDLPAEIKKNIRENVAVSEKEELARLLKAFHGNKTELANYLGITRTGLWKKLKRLGLQK
ncbi:sigma 54-interacting transcriptional regulator [Candidatus Formimonas warabiya]|uniref:Sigma-54 factor interaction domain-containing protein n=1 Tax=Formimonas warabiya TaxID=1761012 RepID=A0A3G1KME8_FORW1|nr:sigma 54-interacting transcriptional regulator [Candidatus Formimonas warabiya]ATW23623.1 hypothetical protein DCMF_01345 [Candidatus Formimonas warabiya]